MAKNLYWREGGWWFGQQINGKRIWKNLKTQDEAEAIRRARTFRSSPEMAPAVGLHAEVDAFIAYKRAKGRYSQNSAKTKIIILKAFANWLPNTASLASVTPAQCEGFYHAVQQPGFADKEKRHLKKDPEPAGASTAHSYMMTLRSFFRWAVEVRRARFDNPVAEVEFPKVEHRARHRFCDKETKNRLIASAPNDDLRFILYCGFDAGLRRDEIVEARRDWFDLEGGSVQTLNAKRERLRPGEREYTVKNGKQRHIPLTHPFREFLKTYLEGREPLDFALMKDKKHGTWRYRYDFRRPFTDFMRGQKLPWVTPHVMRHSFASILKGAGESIAKIADWLGDTERVTERNYAHLKPDDRGIHALT